MSQILEFEESELCQKAQNLARKWGFAPTERLPSGHCSHVFADATRVLKVPFQGEEMTSGLQASLFLSGNSGPQVLASDKATGIQLMQRITPGIPLSQSQFTDEQNQDIAMNLAAQFTLNWRQGMIPLRQYFQRESELAEKLFATTKQNVFLHGDLHHFNILKHTDRWLTIDAKGLFGDPAYEAVAYLRNPIPEVANWPNLDQILHHRITRWAERFQLNPWRIWAWAIVDLDDENRDDSDPWTTVLQALKALSFPAPEALS